MGAVSDGKSLKVDLALSEQATSKKAISPLMAKFYKEVENTLSSKLGTKVKIHEGAKKGKIEIEYYSKDDLERILFELKS